MQSQDSLGHAKGEKVQRKWSPTVGTAGNSVLLEERKDWSAPLWPQ